MDGTVTGITTRGQNGPGSNDDEGVIPNLTDLQDWSHTTRSYLVSYAMTGLYFQLWGSTGNW